MKINHQIWMLLGRNKYLYNILRLIADCKSCVEAVKNNTDLVIEGYPRAANTFAFVAIKMMQTNEANFNIAHHLHAPYQLIKGIKYDIPCLLLLREPTDSIVSLLIRENSINPTNAFNNYIKFHNKLEKYIPKIVISDFKRTTNNIPEVVYTINQKYNKKFHFNKTDKHFMNKCRDEIIRMDRNDTGKTEVDKQKVGIPNKEKEKMKNKLRPKILNNVNSNLIRKSKKVYYKFKKKSFSRLL